LASISSMCGLAGIVTGPALQSIQAPSFSFSWIAPHRIPLEKDTMLSAAHMHMILMSHALYVRFETESADVSMRIHRMCRGIHVLYRIEEY